MVNTVWVALVRTDDFTHAILDCEDEIIKKHRWTNTEYKWFINSHPDVKVIKLQQPKKESAYEIALRAVGECLF